VDAADGHAAGVRECGDDHDAVGREPGDGGEGVGDDVRFQRVVPAQGRVAAAHEADGGTGLRGRGERVRDDLSVACLGLGQIKAAGVGHHVHRGRGTIPNLVAERPAEVLSLPPGEHGEVGDGLGPGGIVVEHHEHPGRRRNRGGDGTRGDHVLRRIGREQVRFENHQRLPGIARSIHLSDV